MDCQRVDAACEFAGKRSIDHAVALDPGLPLEGIRHDMHPEMRLAAWTVSGVAFVPAGFIDHQQALGRESFGQFLYDKLAQRHGRL